MLVLAPSLPLDLPTLVAAAARLLYALAALALHTAVLSVPLALWLLFGPAGGVVVRVPPAVADVAARLSPALAPLAARPLALPQLHWTAAAALLALLWAAERVVRARRIAAWEVAVRDATPEQVLAAHKGWAPPGASGGGGGEPLFDSLASEVQELHSTVLGADSRPLQLDSLADVAAALQRLCQETGVEMPAGAAGSAGGLLEVTAAVRQAVGE